jgi:cell wall-associated NlpC family hydrolase/nucleoid-associated protein YgaU
MFDQSRERSVRMARRERISRASTRAAVARRAFKREATRVGFHGVVVALGFAVAFSAWHNPRDPLRISQLAADHLSELAADAALAELFEDATGPQTPLRSAGPLEPALKPLTRLVGEGDTLRAIAAEYAVSISTILASNKLEDPDLIHPGQELLIPPVEGVVAEIESGETLAQLAARMGVEPLQIAVANALPEDPDQAIPYERLIVPGLEPAERAAAAPRRKQPAVAASERATIEPSDASKLAGVDYQVQDGDSLAQLSAQFGVSVWTILTANNLADADLIRPGMTLKVLPVNGIEHEVQVGESLYDVAAYYEVDLGLLVDFNTLSDPDSLKVGAKLTIPGAEKTQPLASLAGSAAPVASAPIGAPTVRAAPQTSVAQASRPAQSVAVAQKPAAKTALAQAAPAQAAAKPAVAAKPQAPQAVAKSKPNQVQAASVTAPVGISGGGSGNVVSAAMRHLGARYVFGGTSPGGFDCSGFVWYVHQAAGKPVSRGLWGQMNGGPRISQAQLQAGDTVFFANTYMPGLSHSGIYIGGGRFIHASDELSGVKISSIGDSYWGPRYIGASRLH